jgi:hypothetical protein
MGEESVFMYVHMPFLKFGKGFFINPQGFGIMITNGRWMREQYTAENFNEG